MLILYIRSTTEAKNIISCSREFTPRSVVVSMCMNCIKFKASQVQTDFEGKMTSNFLLNKSEMKDARAECIERAWWQKSALHMKHASLQLFSVKLQHTILCWIYSSGFLARMWVNSFSEPYLNLLCCSHSTKSIRNGSQKLLKIKPKILLM